MNLDEPAVIVWISEEALNKPQKRLLETLTSRNSRLPLAFSVRTLQMSVPYATTADEETLQDSLLRSSKDNPVIIPISLARSSLGWTEFDIAGDERSVHD